MTDYINPSKDSFASFNALTREGPVQMLNLIQLRVQAAYEDGRNETGKAAYAAYGRKSAAIFAGFGGQIIWSGRPEVMVIGPQDAEQWDMAFIAQYPDIASFRAMVQDPGYAAVVFHRTAAVKDSRLIRLQATAPDAFFGDSA